MPALADALERAGVQRECCSNCLFWIIRNNAARGTCHRFPPQVVQGRQEPPHDAHPNWQPRPEHYFPIVEHDQWCGEFERRNGQ